MTGSLREYRTYESIEKVAGTPMTRLEYNQFRGWELPLDEDGTDDGFLLHREHGPVNWVEAEQFKLTYKETK